jgi:hypothetical protein
MKLTAMLPVPESMIPSLSQQAGEMVGVLNSRLRRNDHGTLIFRSNF